MASSAASTRADSRPATSARSPNSWNEAPQSATDATNAAMIPIPANSPNQAKIGIFAAQNERNPTAAVNELNRLGRKQNPSERTRAWRVVSPLRSSWARSWAKVEAK